MAMDKETFKARTISRLKEYINNFQGIKNSHVGFDTKTGTKGLWHREAILIRLWVDKDLFNAHDIALKLETSLGFKEHIAKIVAANFVIKYDIYEM